MKYRDKKHVADPVFVEIYSPSLYRQSWVNEVQRETL